MKYPFLTHHYDINDLLLVVGETQACVCTTAGYCLMEEYPNLAPYKEKVYSYLHQISFSFSLLKYTSLWYCATRNNDIYLLLLVTLS